MSKLQRVLKETFKRGNWEKGTVEQTALGKATVIARSGKRYTNLPVVGTALEAGDKVAIDFSTETPSVYLLSDIYEDEPKDLELGQYAGVGEIIDNIDVGVSAVNAGDGYYDILPSRHAGRNDPYIWEWGYNSIEVYEGCAEVWDTNDFLNHTDLRGPTHLEIPVTGRYLLYFGFAHDFYHLKTKTNFLVFNDDAYTRIRFYKNDTTLLFEINHREWDEYEQEWGIIGITMVELEAGDQVSMEFFHTFDFPGDWSAVYGEQQGDFRFRRYADPGPMLFTLQLIPGTQEE